jgi:hypothetical protein
MDKKLILTLKKIYFDAILSGTKTEEYRGIKPWSISRLWRNGKSIVYSSVIFKNGYRKNAPVMEVEFKKCIRDEKKGIFIISLGKVLNHE